MPKHAEELVDETFKSLEQFDIPDELRSSISKHHANLVGLAGSLLDSGQEKEAVLRTLDLVFASYKTELAKTILALRTDG